MSQVPESMNVAIVIDDTIAFPPKNGVTYRFYHAAKNLMNHAGICVFIADRGATEIEKIAADGFHASIFPSNWLYDEEKYPEVLALFQAKGINIVHVCNAHTMVPMYGFKLCRDLNASLICDMHDIYADLLPKDACFDEERTSELQTQMIVGKYADKICVISRSDLQKLAALGIDSEKMVWTPIGIDCIATEKREPTENNVVFLGNMFYGPNYDAAKLISERLVDAVRERVPDVTFTLIGNAPEDIQELKNVNYLGPQDDLAPHFKKAALGIAPLASGSGMKVKMLSYAAHGLPVVCTSIAATGYDDNEGFIITDDFDSMVRSIIDLLQSPQAALEKGRAAKEYVRRHFTWEQISADQYKLYEDLHTQRQTTAINGPVVPFKIAPSGHTVIDGVSLKRPQHLQEKRYKLVASQQKNQIYTL